MSAISTIESTDETAFSQQPALVSPQPSVIYKPQTFSNTATGSTVSALPTASALLSTLQNQDTTSSSSLNEPLIIGGISLLLAIVFRMLRQR